MSVTSSPPPGTTVSPEGHQPMPRGTFAEGRSQLRSQLRGGAPGLVGRGKIHNDSQTLERQRALRAVSNSSFYSPCFFHILSLRQQRAER